MVLSIVCFGLVPLLMPIWGAVSDPFAWRIALEDCHLVVALASTTGRVVLGTWVVAVPIGTLVAIRIFRLPRRHPRVALAALAAGVFCPPVFFAGAWQSMSQLFRTWAGSWMLSEPYVAVIGIQSLAAIPWIAAMAGLSLTAVDPSLEESGALDTTTLRVLLWITIPRIRAAILLAAIVVAALVFCDMTVPDLFAIRTFAEEAYTRIELAEGEHAATLLAMPAAMILAAALAAAFALTLPARSSHGGTSLAADQSTWLLYLAAGACAGVYATLLFALACQTGLVQNGPLGPTRWSMAAFASYLFGATAQSGRTLLTTALAAGTSGAVTTFVAGLWAWRMNHGSWTARAGLILLCAMLVAMPAPIIALGLIELFNRPGWWGEVYDSPIPVVLGMVVRSLPVAAAWLAVVFAGLPTSLVEAARVEGAGAWTTLWQVAIPARRGAIITTAIGATMLAAGELPMTKLLAPPGVDLLAPRIFQLLHTGTGNEQAALALLLFGVAMLCGWFFLAARKR